MATSKFETNQYPAESFVESAGAVLFKVSTRQICIVHHSKKDEWLLAKGRRNVGESRHDTALRELEEETGFKANLLKCTMTTRAPPAIEDNTDTADRPRVHQDVCEPFKLTTRQLEGPANLKIIWWYIAAIDENTGIGHGEEKFNAKLFTLDEVISRLTYETDRDIVRKAIAIFEDTYGLIER